MGYITDYISNKNVRMARINLKNNTIELRKAKCVFTQECVDKDLPKYLNINNRKVYSYCLQSLA